MTPFYKWPNRAHSCYVDFIVKDNEKHDSNHITPRTNISNISLIKASRTKSTYYRAFVYPLKVKRAGHEYLPPPYMTANAMEDNHDTSLVLALNISSISL